MLLEQRDLLPIGGAGIALRSRAGVQRDRGGALGFGDAAGIEVGVMVVVDADAELHGHRYWVPSVARTAAATIWPNSRRLKGSAAPPPRLVTLGTGQPKFMSM